MRLIQYTARAVSIVCAAIGSAFYAIGAAADRAANWASDKIEPVEKADG